MYGRRGQNAKCMGVSQIWLNAVSKKLSKIRCQSGREQRVKLGEGCVSVTQNCDSRERCKEEN